MTKKTEKYYLLPIEEEPHFLFCFLFDFFLHFDPYFYEEKIDRRKQIKNKNQWSKITLTVVFIVNLEIDFLVTSSKC